MARSARWISDPEAIACLTSPLRQRILDRLEAIGPASAAELATSLRLAPDRLYYHLKLLQKVDLITLAGTRGSGASQQVLYDLSAQDWHLAYQPVEPKRAAAFNKLTAAMLRQARRDFEEGWEHPHVRGLGEQRNLWSLRLEAHLDEEELADLNGHLQAIVDLLRKPQRGGDGTHVALTWVLAPQRAHDAD